MHSLRSPVKLSRLLGTRVYGGGTLIDTRTSVLLASCRLMGSSNMPAGRA